MDRQSVGKPAGLKPRGKGRLGQLSDPAARVSACNAILERAYGKAPTNAPIVIDLPKTETAANVCEAMSKVIQSVAAGRITPADASSLCGLLESQRRIIELTELEVRIAAIEARGQ